MTAFWLPHQHQLTRLVALVGVSIARAFRMGKQWCGATCPQRCKTSQWSWGHREHISGAGLRALSVQARLLSSKIPLRLQGS